MHIIIGIILFLIFAPFIAMILPAALGVISIICALFYISTFPEHIPFIGLVILMGIIIEYMNKKING